MLESLPQSDLNIFWCGAKIFLSGGNPYDTITYAACLGADPNSPNLATILSPPFIFLIAVPFGFVSFETAKAIWPFLNLIISIVSFLILRELLFIKKGKGPGLALLAFLTCWGVFCSIGLGQLTSVYLLSFTLFLLFTTRDSPKSFWAGLFLTPFLAKPHLILFVWPLLVYYGRKAKNFRTLYGFFLGAVISVLIAIAINPTIFSMYLHRPTLAVPHWLTPTISSILSSWTSVPRIFFSIILVAITAVWVKKGELLSTFSLDQCFIIAVLLSLICTPYAWTYDFGLLLPLTMILINHSMLYAVAIVILNFLLFYLPRMVGSSMHYSFYYPLILLILVAAINRPPKTSDVS